MDWHHVKAAAVRLNLVGNPRRLAVLDALAEEDRDIAALSARLDELTGQAIPPTSVRNLVAELKNAGIVAAEQRGRSAAYSLTDSGHFLAGVIRSHHLA